MSRPKWLDGSGYSDSPGNGLEVPQFEKARKVHDWRNHVPDDLAEAWEFLTISERAIIYRFASEQAHDERWE